MTTIATCRECGERFPSHDPKLAPRCGICAPRDVGIDWRAIPVDPGRHLRYADEHFGRGPILWLLSEHGDCGSGCDHRRTVGEALGRPAAGRGGA